MTKRISFTKKLSSVLFWSIISAAFIGPGTVTTASKAGASHGSALLWALVFSTLATIVLQEAAARITIATGLNLGQIIVKKYQQAKKWRIPIILFIGIFVGCLAYEAGNVLGAISGLELLGNIPKLPLIMVMGVLASALLWTGNFQIIARVMGLVVGIMGLVFIVSAFTIDIPLKKILSSMVIPSMPEGSAILVIGLIGTTIVPYNLFLASGISQGQDIREMRFGIILAVIIGGLISMAILLVGTNVTGTFSFSAIGEALSKAFGSFGHGLFAVGLFAAGFTSTITAPLAAAITGQSLFSSDANKSDWEPTSFRFRIIWGSIILAGMIFSLTGVKPVPAIIAAQAANGILLPLFTSFLFLVMNDKKLLPKAYRNSNWINLFMLAIVGTTLFLGAYNLLGTIEQIFGIGMSSQTRITCSLISGIAIVVVLMIKWLRNKSDE